MINSFFIIIIIFLRIPIAFSTTLLVGLCAPGNRRSISSFRFQDTGGIIHLLNG